MTSRTRIPAARALVALCTILTLAAPSFAALGAGRISACSGCGGRCCAPADARQGCRVTKRCCGASGVPVDLSGGLKAVPLVRPGEPAAPTLSGFLPAHAPGSVDGRGPEPKVPPPRGAAPASIA